MSNIPITAGSGSASVATEQIGTVNFQQIKVINGTVGSTTPWIINGDGSAQVSVIGNHSVSGTLGASIIGAIPVQFSNSSIITVIQGSIAATIVSGSITAMFTPPANQSVSGTIQADIRGSVATVIIGGSIAASFTPPANQSVSGTIQVDVRGSVATVIIGGSIAASFTPPANQSVSGTAGASIIGQLPAGTAVLGSIAALQGTNPWIETFSNSSILAVPVGSVITVWQNPSIVGTYAEDAAHTTADKGLFSLNVRNDTLSSVTSTDGDYGALSVGPAGEGIVANAPLTKWVQGTADFRQGNTGASVVLIAAQGASVFTYITGVQIANMGSASVLVTLAGTGSTLGYSIAPAGGGSNIYYPNALKTPANGTFAASISGVASVLVSAQGFVSKT